MPRMEVNFREFDSYTVPGDWLGVLQILEDNLANRLTPIEPEEAHDMAATLGRVLGSAWPHRDV